MTEHCVPETATTDRRGFLRAACVAGICSCAGAGVAAGSVTAGAADAAGDGVAPGGSGGVAVDSRAQEDPMPRRWIGALLPVLAASADQARAAQVLRGAAASHWEELGMAERVAPYRGNLAGFLKFLSAEWGWKIGHEAGSRTILIDEAKNYCVCPLVARELRTPGAPGARELGVLCHCSEGFAERLFSTVVGRPVRAEVTQSVLRGGASCHYRITLDGPA